MRLISYNITLETEFGCFEDVPLECVIWHEEDGPVPQRVVINDLRLTVGQVKAMIGADEWERQMALFDRWWSENAGQIDRAERQYHYERMTAAE